VSAAKPADQLSSIPEGEMSLGKRFLSRGYHYSPHRAIKGLKTRPIAEFSNLISLIIEYKFPIALGNI
jgi:hypothetical protein